MSHVFGEFDGPVHRTHLPSVGMHLTLSPTVRTSRLVQVFTSDFAGSSRLNHPAQLLADLVSRQFDLVEMRRLLALIRGLQLGS